MDDLALSTQDRRLATINQSLERIAFALEVLAKHADPSFETRSALKRSSMVERERNKQRPSE